MSQEISADDSWVVFRLQKQFFALPVAETQEMFVVPEVTPIPRAPVFVRGVINMRGRVMPLLDLRVRLGMPSSLEERDNLVTLLEQREKDHRDWLMELEASVRERRKFRLTTDPHACAFGKWYDSFSTDNLRLTGNLLKFDAPHQRVHAVGKEVEALVGKGEYDAALALVDRTRETTLSKLINLFIEVRDTIRKSHVDIAVVVERQGKVVALTVDAVDAVEALNLEGQEQAASGSYGSLAKNLVAGIARRLEGGEMVLLLDVPRLLDEVQDL